MFRYGGTGGYGDPHLDFVFCYSKVYTLDAKTLILLKNWGHIVAKNWLVLLDWEGHQVFVCLITWLIYSINFYVTFFRFQFCHVLKHCKMFSIVPDIELSDRIFFKKFGVSIERKSSVIINASCKEKQSQGKQFGLQENCMGLPETLRNWNTVRTQTFSLKM